MSAIVVNGELVHYEVLGRGRPVVLLHGMLGSWRYWVPLLQRLQQSYRLYALDLFGFGDSARNPAHFTLERQMELVKAVMDELGLPKAAFIGHGLGALVAAEFARRHPAHAARLLLVSAPLFDPGDLERRVPVAPAAPAPPAPVAPPPAAAKAPVNGSSAGASAAMRAALAESARARRPGSAAEDLKPAASPVLVAEAPAPAPVPTTPEPAAAPAPARASELAPILGQSLETLLGRCFRRSDDNYAKLMVDVAKADARAPALLGADYDGGALLDTLRLLPMPIAAVHGADDALFPPPPEAVWAYLTADPDRAFVPILLPGVRHFPMLEDERFYRVAGDFLEAADITKIELRERWRRRTR
jgi:pimeloyl-ACP methyl ester carboxylesterase